MTIHRGAASNGEGKSGEERVRERSGEKNLGRWLSRRLSSSEADERKRCELRFVHFIRLLQDVREEVLALLHFAW